MIVPTLVRLLAVASLANAYSLSTYPKLKAVYDRYNKAVTSMIKRDS